MARHGETWQWYIGVLLGAIAVGLFMVGLLLALRHVPIGRPIPEDVVELGIPAVGGAVSVGVIGLISWGILQRNKSKTPN